MNATSTATADHRRTEPTQQRAAPVGRPVPGTALRSEATRRPGRSCVELPIERLRRAKFAYTVRAVEQSVRSDALAGLALETGAAVVPRAGDIVLARVVELGQHRRLEGTGSRRQQLFVGDEIVVAYGNRYAPDQFLAEVPADLGVVQLVAAGGMASAVIDRHADIQPATVIEPIGLVADASGPLRLDRIGTRRLRPWREALAAASAPRRPHLTVVLGSSMNSGKSTVAASLVNGLGRAGLVVAAGKGTGTGAGNDTGLFRDAGARQVLDFTDFGYTSTYRLGSDTVLDLVASVLADLAAEGPDAIVLEIADGLIQPETAELLTHPEFRDRIDSVLFACGEALSAVAGIRLLAEQRLPVRAVSGVLTSAPLIVREAARLLPVPVVPTFELSEPDTARSVTRATVLPAAAA